eukprot:scaffold5850_cov110-Cylindrotheca_fusiformis.AAC.5
MSCPVCFEDDTSALIRLCCGHSCCQDCLKRWFETEEKTGQSLPTCPVETCRRAPESSIISAVLGRAFVPAGSNTKKRKSVAVDESTQKWMTENTLECGGCQTPLIKSEGCDKLQCLCGYRVCWNCRTPGAKCRCNPGHAFVNNITGLPSWGRSNVASPNELQNFKQFLEDEKRTTSLSMFAHSTSFGPPSDAAFIRSLLDSSNTTNHAHPIRPPRRGLSFGNRDRLASRSSRARARQDHPMIPRKQSLYNAALPDRERKSVGESGGVFHDTNYYSISSKRRRNMPAQDNHKQQEDDVAQFEKDMERAMRLSTIGASTTATAALPISPVRFFSAGNTATNPHWIEDDRIPAARNNLASLFSSGKSANDPVCLDDDDQIRAARSNLASLVSSGKSANDPVCLDNDDQIPAARNNLASLFSSGKSANDPVCLDSDDEK